MQWKRDEERDEEGAEGEGAETGSHEGYTTGGQSDGAVDEGGGDGESHEQADAEAEADGDAISSSGVREGYIMSKQSGGALDETSASEATIEATKTAGSAASSASASSSSDAAAASLQGTYDRGVAIFSPELVLHAQEVWDRLAPQVHAMHAGPGRESLGKAGKAMSGVYAVVLSAQVCDRQGAGISGGGGGRGVLGRGWAQPQVLVL